MSRAPWCRLQITAAVRCKRSKWVFLLLALVGTDWKENDLFHAPDQVSPVRV